MNIKVVVVGELQTNCYILNKGDCNLIIDPGADLDVITAQIPSDQKVVGIVITHSHDDHTGASLPLLNKYGASLYNANNLDEGKRSIANFEFEVIETPGHSDDSITLYFKEEKVMFCGDFVFKGGIGRTDMESSSPYDMRKSIEKILTYPKDVTLMPGHFGVTLLGDEVDNLNYFKSIL